MGPSAREAMQQAFDCDVDRVFSDGLAALPDLDKAREAARVLARTRGDRAVFALCVLTLELARNKDEEARAALPARVGVLLEAYRHPTLARVLVAGNPALKSRWEKILPIVGEFMASRTARGAPAADLDVDPSEEKRAPAQAAGDASAAARLSTSVEIIEEISVLLEHEKEAAPAEVPPPAQPLPAPAARRKPPPLPPLTPPPVAIQPGRPPPLPAARPAAAPAEREAASPQAAEAPVDQAVKAFWIFAEQALGRVPDETQSLAHAECFAAERAADRANLVRFARELLARFPKVRQARALASLTLLYVAGQEKTRGLLGVNRERLETIRIALTLLSDLQAGGYAAVLFEADGVRTRRAFVNVVDLLHSYLAFCLQHQLDPQGPEAAAKFTKA